VFQMILNSIERAVDIFHQVCIPDSHYLPALRFQEHRSLQIMFLLSGLPMRVAVQLHNQFHLHTGEVSEVWPHRMLSPEFPACQLAVA